MKSISWKSLVSVYTLLIILSSSTTTTRALDKRVALRFCHEGRIYTASMSQCPGGILLKPSFKHLPDCICANGIFMHKGSSSNEPFEGLFASRGMRCMEYKTKSYSDWNLFLSLTQPDAPFNDTVTVIPYEPGSDRLDYFKLRRYNVDELRKPGAQPLTEELSREKIFYVSHHKNRVTEQIQVGDLCLNKTIGFYDGVYIDDLEPNTIRGNEVMHTVGNKCEDATTKFSISRRSKVHHYGRYVNRECRMASNCIHDPDTNLELPDLSDEYLDDDEELQRLPREAKCDKIIEENVQLAEYFTRLLHKQVLGYNFLPNSGPFQIVEASLGVYKAVISTDVVSHKVLDQIFRYFYYLYFNRLGKRRNEEKDFTEKLLYALNHCKLNSRDMRFITKGCPAKVEYYKRAKSLFDYEYVTVELPADDKFDEAQHDIIPEAMFKIVNFVYTYCIPYFDTRTQQRKHFRKEMKMLFSLQSLQNRWIKKCEQISKVMQYRSILPYGDLNIFMNNMDATVAAMMMDPKAKDYIKRPVRKQKTRRRRRSILDYEGYEIWNGAAYCLQVKEYPNSTGPQTWGILPDITRIVTPSF